MQNKAIYSDKEGEIDLAGLLSKGWEVFRRRLILFLIFIALGIALGIVYYNVKQKIYKSRMIISSTVFQGPSFVLILENLQLLLKEDNYEELASILGMDVLTVKKIKKIEIYSSKNYAEQAFGDKVSFKKDEKLGEEKDKKEKSEEFVIEAFVLENAIFPKLEQGILYYINNNPSLKESSASKKEALHQMIAHIRKQRLQLDSLQGSIVGLLNKKNNPSDFFIGEPGAMFTDMIELYQDEIRATEAIFNSNMNVVEGFRQYKKQDSPRLGMSLICFTLVFIFLFLVTVIYLEVNRKEKVA